MKEQGLCGKLVVCAAAAVIMAGASFAAGRVEKEIAYDPSIGAFGVGTLTLPRNWTPDTPMALFIHGGGWTSGERAGLNGIVRLFTRKLGLAVYNIEYRLASPTNRWPACGDDCVKAAKFLLSDEFKRQYGFRYRKIWIQGGSAGGHLTLWTLTHLPPECVAGAISVSSIGDPDCDVLGQRHSQRIMLGPEMDYARMNPILSIKSGMAPLLCTHATGDKVVPIASHRAFFDAYRAAGNVAEFFEYPCDVVPGLTGHCIWTPTRDLIPPIERKIREFVGRYERLPAAARADGKPQLLFKAGFDGTAVAEKAEGEAKPVPRTRNLRFVPGKRGQALEMRPGMDTALVYDADGNLVPERGALSFWFKPNPATLGKAKDLDRRYFFCTQPGQPRAGGGELWFWRFGNLLRADVSDDGDSYATSAAKLVDGWNHLTFNWSEQGSSIWLNGRDVSDGRNSVSGLFRAAQKKFPLPPGGQLSFSRRFMPAKFFVGGFGGSAHMDGAIDELEIWSAPLSPEQIAAKAGVDQDAARQKNAVLRRRFDAAGPNPHVAAPCGAGGEIPDLELVESVRFDAIPTDTNRFVSFGELRIGRLKGVKYLEAGRLAGDRWAYRFLLPHDNAPLYVIDVDYPDDMKRTMDVMVQGSRERRWDGTRGADYVLQAGVACGDEYANSGKILTDRYLYWRRGDDVTLSTMTCRGEAPAAIAAVRIYRVRSGRLPAAAVNEPPANGNGWRRTFALYYEDVSVGYNFAVPGDGGDEASIGPMLDRLVATMKFTGQNALCYPGCWYGGLMGEKYSPRSHLPDYRSAYYEKFDREGLFYLPTINQFSVPLSQVEICAAPGADGTCHGSPLTILDDGKIASSASHGRPTAFNVLHPAVQRDVLKSVDTFIAEGKDHPSFKGVVLHLTRNSVLWFGNDRGGYNDYAVKAFARERGIAVPSFDGNPLRGKEYAAWIRANAFDAWIDWRCEKVAAFYREIARRLATARPDLKLVINSFLLPDWRHPDFPKPDFLEQANRRGGLDARKLADVANISICQSQMPADYRWFGPRDPTNPKDNGHWREMRAVAEPAHRVLYEQTGSFGSVFGSGYPWVNQHDRYWEDHSAATKDFNCHGLYPHGGRHRPLTNSWFAECPWRVSTVNPSGRDALRAYAVPLRFTDVLAMSKGGFLIGTYGTEDVLVPWMRAFRALPAVRMRDVAGFADAFVRIRHADFGGKSYFYVVNTDARARPLSCEMPAGTVDLVSGRQQAGKVRLDLEPYELRAYAAPGGVPR